MRLTDSIVPSVYDEAGVYKKERQKYRLYLAGGLLLSVTLLLISLFAGNYSTPVPTVIDALLHRTPNSERIYSIVVYSRLPRVLAAILIGSALSLAGAAYQSAFQNWMVSPDILGVSAGAGVGAALGFLANYSTPMMSFTAFLFGLGSVILTSVTAKLFGESADRTISLVLSGIIVSGLMNAIIGLIKYIATNPQLASITYWLLGGLNDISYRDLLFVAPVILCSAVILILIRWQISMLSRGVDDAVTHGIRYHQVMDTTIVISSVMTATAVSVSGTIGWIGLVIPNLMRLFIGDDGRMLLPLTAVYGMAFTMAADLAARTISNAEIPIGIITGILGTPVFVLILLLRRSRHGM